MAPRALLAGLLAGTGAAALPACGGEGADSPTTPRRDAAAGIARIAVVSRPETGETNLAGEEVSIGVWLTSGLPVEAVGEVFLHFDLGLARQPARLRETGGERLEFRYSVRRGDYDGDGISVPEGELAFSSGAVLSVGGVPVDIRVPALPAEGGHRVFARFAPGERVVFADGSATLAGALEEVPAAGCSDPEDAAAVVEAALAGDPARAASLYAAAFSGGRCAELPPAEPALFLTAEIRDYEGVPYDLALAFGPGDGARGREQANWWTLADFLAPSGGALRFSPLRFTP